MSYFINKEASMGPSMQSLLNGFSDELEKISMRTLPRKVSGILRRPGAGTNPSDLMANMRDSARLRANKAKLLANRAGGHAQGGGRRAIPKNTPGMKPDLVTDIPDSIARYGRGRK